MLRRDFLYRSAAGMIVGVASSRAKEVHASAPAPRRKVRLGVIGTQHAHAAGKLAALRELHAEFELVAVVEPDEQLQNAFRSHRRYQGVPWLPLDELLSSSDVDAVVIETAVRDLVPIAQRCIDAGKHVHLEKPGSESRKAFVHLFDSARERGRHIQMGYMLRHNPAFEFCFRAVREGWLGRVLEVTGSIGKLVDDKQRPEFAEYSAMFELGCHLIDAMITILGPPKNITPFNRETRADGILDNQVAVFEYSIAIATIRSSIVEPYGNDRRHFEVSGENGTIAIRPLEPPQMKLALQRPAGRYDVGQHEITLQEPAGRYHMQLREFAGIVRGDMASRWTFEHDQAVHQAVLRASGMPG
jgi:predicted dehydrogenase